MTYVFSVLPTPQEFIKQLNTIIYNFLWNGPYKIARLAVINDIKYGGLRLTDIETSIISLRLAWLGRIHSPGRIPWKAFLDYLLENYGGTFFVSCNYNMRDYNINSSFYSELLQWWDDFRNAFSTLPLTAENIIWNNKLIKIDGKSIYYHNYVKIDRYFIKHHCSHRLNYGILTKTDDNKEKKKKNYLHLINKLKIKLFFKRSVSHRGRVKSLLRLSA